MGKIMISRLKLIRKIFKLTEILLIRVSFPQFIIKILRLLLHFSFVTILNSDLYSQITLSKHS